MEDFLSKEKDLVEHLPTTTSQAQGRSKVIKKVINKLGGGYTLDLWM